MEQVTGGGGGSRRWLWIGLAGGGAAAAAVILATRNHPPDAGTISVSPTATGMAGVTSFSFTSTASDEDGDTLTYNWNFGDGSTGSGANPTRIFSTAGTFTVSLTVSDGKETVTAPSTTVRVGPSIAGTWTGGSEPGFDCGVNTALTQSGGTIGGTFILTSGCTGNISMASGSVTPLTHPATVTWTTVNTTFITSEGTVFTGITWRFTGTTDANGTVLSGTLTVTSAPLNVSFSRAVTFRR